MEINLALGKGARFVILESQPFYMADPTNTAQKIIPVSILAGFLGAGKTTLLNHILREQSDYKFAVIINEIGKIGIDGALVETNKDEVVEMSNGCVCCTVRKDLVVRLPRLIKRGGRL